jgi:hypothetical protein
MYENDGSTFGNCLFDEQGIIAKDDKHNAILQCIDSLSEAIESVNDSLTIYQNRLNRELNIRLKTLVLCISMAIFEVVLAAIAWFKRKTARKF